MRLFAEGRLVVANHGAGLTNLIFRIDHALQVVEMFSSDYIKPNFVWLAREFGFGYDALVGEAVGRGDFPIDPSRFQATIAAAVARVEAEQKVLDRPQGLSCRRNCDFGLRPRIPG